MTKYILMTLIVAMGIAIDVYKASSIHDGKFLILYGIAILVVIVAVVISMTLGMLIGKIDKVCSNE